MEEDKKSTASEAETKVVTGATATGFDPDKTYTVEEMETHGRYSLVPKEGREVRRTSASAHRFLKESFLGRWPAYQDSILWNSMILTRAKALGRTLNLAEVQELFLQRQVALNKKEEEFDQLRELRADESAPEKDHCGFPNDGGACGFEFEPKTWNVVREGKVLVHLKGGLKGSPITEGNYVINRKEGVVVPLCPRCTKDTKRNGGRVYPKSVAESILRGKEVREGAYDAFRPERPSRRPEWGGRQITGMNDRPRRPLR